MNERRTKISAVFVGGTSDAGPDPSDDVTGPDPSAGPADDGTPDGPHSAGTVAFDDAGNLVPYSGPVPGPSDENGAGSRTGGGSRTTQTRRSKKAAPRTSAARSGQKTGAARSTPSRSPGTVRAAGKTAGNTANAERPNAPLDLNLPGKLVAKTPNLVDVLTGVLRIVADINVTTKPELPQGPGITFGPDALKRRSPRTAGPR